MTRRPPLVYSYQVDFMQGILEQELLHPVLGYHPCKWIVGVTGISPKSVLRFQHDQDMPSLTVPLDASITLKGKNGTYENQPTLERIENTRPRIRYDSYLDALMDPNFLGFTLRSWPAHHPPESPYEPEDVGSLVAHWDSFRDANGYLYSRVHFHVADIIGTDKDRNMRESTIFKPEKQLLIPVKTGQDACVIGTYVDITEDEGYVFPCVSCTEIREQLTEGGRARIGLAARVYRVG